MARLKACDPPWVLTAGAADIRRAGVLTAGTTGGSEPPRILTTGLTNIAQSGLSLGHSASGAIAGAAADSAVTSQPTEGHRAKEAKRGDWEREATTKLKLTTPPPTRAAGRRARDPTTPLGRSGCTERGPGRP